MEQQKPAWWQLYLIMPVAFGSGVAEELAPLPGVSPQIVYVAIVVLAFVAMLVWVHANGGLLEWYYMDSDETGYDLKITVYDPKSKQLDENSSEAVQYQLYPTVKRVRAGWYIEEKDDEKWRLN